MRKKIGEFGIATGRLLPAVVIAALAVVSAGTGYVVAQSVLGRGTLTVRVVAPQYAISVQFYADQNATTPISSLDISVGGSQIIYAKLTNTSNNDYMNLYVMGGGQKLWMNVYKLDGSGLFVDGNVVGHFNLAKNQSIIVKVLVGVTPDASAGDTLTLGLDVMKD
ncbi:MAG: hypothetical protein QXU01_01830 [Candidatus Hadarchaeales archaeon]